MTNAKQVPADSNEHRINVSTIVVVVSWPSPDDEHAGWPRCRGRAVERVVNAVARLASPQEERDAALRASRIVQTPPVPCRWRPAVRKANSSGSRARPPVDDVVLVSHAATATSRPGPWSRRRPRDASTLPSDLVIITVSECTRTPSAAQPAFMEGSLSASLFCLAAVKKHLLISFPPRADALSSIPVHLCSKCRNRSVLRSLSSQLCALIEAELCWWTPCWWS